VGKGPQAVIALLLKPTVEMLVTGYKMHQGL
jgi:hypothetical protein